MFMNKLNFISATFIYNICMYNTLTLTYLSANDRQTILQFMFVCVCENLINWCMYKCICIYFLRVLAKEILKYVLHIINWNGHNNNLVILTKYC